MLADTTDKQTKRPVLKTSTYFSFLYW